MCVGRAGAQRGQQEICSLVVPVSFHQGIESFLKLPQASLAGAESQLQVHRGRCGGSSTGGEVPIGRRERGMVIVQTNNICTRPGSCALEAYY